MDRRAPDPGGFRRRPETDPPCAVGGDDDNLATGLDAASRRAGQRLWRMPVVSEYRELLQSEIADIRIRGPQILRPCERHRGRRPRADAKETLRFLTHMAFLGAVRGPRRDACHRSGESRVGRFDMDAGRLSPSAGEEISKCRRTASLPPFACRLCSTPCFALALSGTISRTARQAGPSTVNCATPSSIGVPTSTILSR
ncbi:MAG: hypothetical protein HUU15_04850 [Candidatus Brocadiae bacterium]|nr:hypothetical protein [Candidatus Brocadiia bacterium]